MASRLLLAVAGVAALVMPPAAALAQEEELEPERFFDLRACKRHKLGALSEDERAACEIFKSLDRQGRYKAIVMQRLRQRNLPPVAAIEILEVLPRRVDVSAEGSTDEDGFPELHHFSLEDADTGELLAGPVTSRNSVASLLAEQDLPQNLRVVATVEDDLGAIDTVEEIVLLGATACSNEFFSCTFAAGETLCTPTSANKVFTTDDLLDAVQRCDRSATKSRQLRITAKGGGGGRGSNVWPWKGGSGGQGGAARMATTLAELDRVYGSPQDGTTYCYGLGASGWFSGLNSGAGGASSMLRTCQNVSQTEPTGVLLIAGGGGGGQAAQPGGGGSRTGAAGGIVRSTQGAPATAAGGGAGGNDGKGGVGDGGRVGDDGVGGRGGMSSWGTAGFFQGNPRVDGSAGQGAQVDGNGAGGGGFGGGGSPQGGSNAGGGGGSYAAAGLLGPPAPNGNSGAGWLRFLFSPF